MSRVFWDTNLFVYLVEDKGTRADQVVALRQWMIERKDELLTSALTLGEVLVKPIEAGDEETETPLRTRDRSERDGAAVRRACRSHIRGNSPRSFDSRAGTPSSLPVPRRQVRICSLPTTIV